MSILSILGRRQRSKAGQSTSPDKTKNLVPRTQYSFATPDSLVRSMDGEQGAALANLFGSVRYHARPLINRAQAMWLSGRDYPDCPPEEREALVARYISNTNSMGLLPGQQILFAKRKLDDLDLPAEVESRATHFIEEIVNAGMDEKDSPFTMENRSEEKLETLSQLAHAYSAAEMSDQPRSTWNRK